MSDYDLAPIVAHEDTGLQTPHFHSISISISIPRGSTKYPILIEHSGHPLASPILTHIPSTYRPLIHVALPVQSTDLFFHTELFNSRCTDFAS
jgi:hypothetical protein